MVVNESAVVYTFVLANLLCVCLFLGDFRMNTELLSRANDGNSRSAKTTN